MTSFTKNKANGKRYCVVFVYARYSQITAQTGELSTNTRSLITSARSGEEALGIACIEFSKIEVESGFQLANQLVVDLND